MKLQREVTAYLDARRAYLYVAGFYAAAVLAGCFCILGKADPLSGSGQVAFRATRYLPRNHRVRATDFERPPDFPGTLVWLLPDKAQLENKYINVKQIDVNQPIRPTDLAASPSYTQRDGVTLVPVSLQEQAHLSNLLTAGSLIRICPASGDCVADMLDVQALMCSAQGTCHAIAAVPTAAETKIRDALTKGKAQVFVARF